jgi:hypothetical protein
MTKGVGASRRKAFADRRGESKPNLKREKE